MTRISKVFHCVDVGAIDTDLRRTVLFSWRGLANTSAFFQADGEAEVLSCIREAVDDVLQGFYMWARRVQSSANSSLVISSAIV